MVKHSVRKTELLQVRVSLVEKQALVALADKNYLNLSEFVRLIIRSEAKQQGLWPKITERRKPMSHIDQLSELIQLWNSLNDGQRESVLRLLRIIVEEGEDDDKVRV